MSTFISVADYKLHIKDTRLQQTIDADNSLLDEAESTAIAVVRDALYSRYDVDAIFATTSTSRPKQVIRWVLCLALYYLHERLPDRIIPERITKNYDDTLALLTDIEDAKKSTNLPLLIKEDGEPRTKFRWGSNTQKTHEL